MSWQKVYPLTTTVISASVSQIQANWAAIASVLSGEHAGLTSSLSGTHLYGRVSAMASGSYATIAALSNPASGALAFDTTYGVCRIYDGEEWPIVTSSGYARAHLFSNTSQSIYPSSWTTVLVGSVLYYHLSSGTPNSSIVVLADGWYLIIGSATWQIETLSHYQRALGIYVGSTRKAVDTKYGKEEIETEVADIIQLTAGEIVTLRAYHSSTSNISIETANLILTRLS